MVLRFASARLITHAKQLLEDNEEALCVRVLQTIKGMMARDIDFGDKVSRKNILQFLHLVVPYRFEPRLLFWRDSRVNIPMARPNKSYIEPKRTKRCPNSTK